MGDAGLDAFGGLIGLARLGHILGGDQDGFEVNRCQSAEVAVGVTVGMLSIRRAGTSTNLLVHQHIHGDTTRVNAVV